MHGRSERGNLWKPAATTSKYGFVEAIGTRVRIYGGEDDSRTGRQIRRLGPNVGSGEQERTLSNTPDLQTIVKGTVTDKPSSLEETYNQFSHKASWNSASILVFLQLIANEITKGNRPFLVLSQAGYKSLGRKFEKKTGRKHGLKQLKNKYMSLKKDWQA
ncbi:unnamed protein product [Camellia sinensis]